MLVGSKQVLRFYLIKLVHEKEVTIKYRKLNYVYGPPITSLPGIVATVSQHNCLKLILKKKKKVQLIDQLLITENHHLQKG